MVTPFIIKHTNEAGDEMTYTGDNITNISVEFNTPIAPMPLPQMEDKENILIKIEGNTTTANITWKVRDLGASNSPFSCDNSHPFNIEAVASVSAMKIVQFFKDRFVPVTVGDSYRLTIGDELVMEGTLMKMSFSISGTSPVVWDGSMQFVHGNVASSVDGDYAEQPTYASIVDDSASNSIKINDITTSYFGVDDAITGYKVKYKKTSPSPASSWSSVSFTSTDSTDLDFVVSLGSTGTFEVKITAVTATHSENVYTIPTSVTIS